MSEVPFADRMRHFNETTGVMGYMSKAGPLGGNHHPDRCVCQGNPNPTRLTGMELRRGACGPNGDTTPHKHRDDGSCARCGTKCSGYVPHDEAVKLSLLSDAKKIVSEARRGA